MTGLSSFRMIRYRVAHGGCEYRGQQARRDADSASEAQAEQFCREADTWRAGEEAQSLKLNVWSKSLASRYCF